MVSVSKKEVVKSEAGITLTVLIITVIVMMILLGTVIVNISGKEGIINHTRFAVNKSDEASVLDDTQITVTKMAQLWDGNGTIQRYIINKIREKGEEGYKTENEGTITIDDIGVITYVDKNGDEFIFDDDDGIKIMKLNQDGKVEIGKLLPETFQQVEYIESTGTQYIDTNIYFDFTQDFRIVGKAINPDVTKRKVIIGSFTKDVDSYCYSFEFGGNTQSKPGYLRNFFQNRYSSNYNSNVYITNIFSNDALPANKIILYDTYYNASLHNVITEYSYDDINQSYISSVVESSAISDNPLRFFLDYRASTVQIANPVKIGETKIYKSDILVGDFVPCYCTKTVTNVDGQSCPSGTIGLYDTVEGEFYTNQGTGTFLKGNDV